MKEFNSSCWKHYDLLISKEFFFNKSFYFSYLTFFFKDKFIEQSLFNNSFNKKRIQNIRLKLD